MLNRKLLLTLLLLLSMFLFVACSSGWMRNRQKRQRPWPRPRCRRTGLEEVRRGLMDGMSAEELIEAGYVVIAPASQL